MAQEYYANKYGIQLEEFLIWGSEWDLKFWQYNFTTGQGFALTNALKYLVRAGKKEGESYEKDMGKYVDYIRKISFIVWISTISIFNIETIRNNFTI